MIPPKEMQVPRPGEVRRHDASQEQKDHSVSGSLMDRQNLDSDTTEMGSFFAIAVVTWTHPSLMSLVNLFTDNLLTVPCQSPHRSLIYSVPASKAFLVLDEVR